jgi:hypothetical protein
MSHLTELQMLFVFFFHFLLEVCLPKMFLPFFDSVRHLLDLVRTMISFDAIISYLRYKSWYSFPIYNLVLLPALLSGS